MEQPVDAATHSSPRPWPDDTSDLRAHAHALVETLPEPVLEPLVRLLKLAHPALTASGLLSILL